MQVDFERLARKTADDSAAQQAVKSAAASSWAALGTLVHAMHSGRSWNAVRASACVGVGWFCARVCAGACGMRARVA